LEGEIARGGMGAVFKGRDVDLGRDIAVKMMLETHKGRTEMLQRFVEEAQIGGQLQHPGIVPVYELNQTRDRRPYFTMKLVKGQTLAVLLKQRPEGQQDLPRFLGIFEQVCRTMAYAHARGVVHRDLKPSNIMVGNFGEIQVMDWGLAKILASGGCQPPGTGADREVDTPRSPMREETQAGSILGTPAYMSPEQARGEVDTLDERCDVFGLGAILCVILTGQPPHPSADRMVLNRLARHAELGATRARLNACGADAALITLAKQCLQADKEDRPRDAGVVSQAVTAYLESVQARLKQAEVDRAAAQARAGAEQARATAEQARADEEQRRRQAEQARAHTERQRRRLTVALAAAGLLLVAGAGAAGWWYQQDQLEQAEQQKQRDIEEGKRQVAEAAQRAREATRKDYVTKEVTPALQKAEDGLRELQQALGRLLPDEKHPLSVSVLLSDLKQWRDRVQTAKALHQQARKLTDSYPEALAPQQKARLEQLGTQVEQAEAQYQIAQQLDTLRVDGSMVVNGDWRQDQAEPRFAKVFREQLSLDLKSGALPQLAQRIKGSALRYVLAATLDHWADVAPPKLRRACSRWPAGRTRTRGATRCGT
jgi:hypothetical protein